MGWGVRRKRAIFCTSASASQIPLAFSRGPFDDVVDLLATLGHPGDHDRLQRLVVELRRNVGPRRISGDAELLVAARRVVEDGTERRLDGAPGVEIVIALEGGEVVARGRRDLALRLRLVDDVVDELLGRALVLAEGPGAVEPRQIRRKAAVGAARHVMGPALLGDPRVVALRY